MLRNSPRHWCNSFHSPCQLKLARLYQNTKVSIPPLTVTESKVTKLYSSLIKSQNISCSIIRDNVLKGQCHEMDIFWKSKHFNITVLSVHVCADGFDALSKLFTTYTVINFLFASLKLLTNLKMLTKTLFRIPFSAITWCFLVLTSPASGMILHNHRWLPVHISVPVGPLKQVPGRIFKISK